MDLFRGLLLEVEKNTDGVVWIPLTMEGRNKAEVFYHAQLAHDAGFIDAKFLANQVIDEVEVVVQRLTYTGHEFLDAAREEKLWVKAKQTVLSNAGTLTVEALKIALAMLMQQ